MSAITGPIDRELAAEHIASRIKARDSYVITAPPSALSRLSESFEDISGWAAYLDTGLELVLRTDSASVLLVTDVVDSLMSATTAAVIVVSKTVPASVLATAVGQEVPADGSRDLLVLHAAEGVVFWPTLFVDALDIVDPLVAAQLRAQSLSPTETA